MGLLNFLGLSKPSSAPQPSAVAAPDFAIDRARMFDLAQTQQLIALFAVPADRRDASWTAAFFAAVWNASVEMTEPAEFTGPDGFRYLRLNVPREGTAFDSQSLANLAVACVERGSGAALFASPSDSEDAAQFVLSIGRLDGLLTQKSWQGDSIDVAESNGGDDGATFAAEQRNGGHRVLTVAKGHKILTGSPSPQFLSPPIARALHGYMSEHWGIADPRVHLLVDAKMRPSRNLVIGRKRSQFESDEHAADEMARLFWFLPPLRGVILMPEDWQDGDMTPLAALAG